LYDFAPGNQVRFYGWLWSLYEIDGETLALIDAYDWQLLP